MTKTRALNRLHRWTAKLRRRHLQAWLPEPRDGQALVVVPRGTRREHERQRDQLHELEQEAPAFLNS